VIKFDVGLVPLQEPLEPPAPPEPAEPPLEPPVPPDDEPALPPAPVPALLPPVPLPAVGVVPPADEPACELVPALGVGVPPLSLLQPANALAANADKPIPYIQEAFIDMCVSSETPGGARHYARGLGPCRAILWNWYQIRFVAHPGGFLWASAADCDAIQDFSEILLAVFGPFYWPSDTLMRRKSLQSSALE
jgi:hypothetical protein